MKEVMNADELSASTATSGHQKPFEKVFVTPHETTQQQVGANANFPVAVSSACFLVYSAHQYLIVSGTGKILGLSQVGELGIAYAVVTPLSVFAGMALKALCATDPGVIQNLGNYRSAQRYAQCAAAIFLLCIAYSYRHNAAVALLVVTTGCARMADVYSETLYGHLLAQNKLRGVAVSQLLKGLLGPICFLGSLWIWKSLLFSSLWLLFAYVSVICFHDSRLFQGGGRMVLKPTRSVGAILGMGLSLSTTAGLASLNISLPRLFLQHFHGKADVGLFTLFSLIPQGSLAILASICQPLLSRLARAHQKKEPAELRRLIVRLIATVALLNACLLLASYVVPEHLIERLRTLEHTDFRLLMNGVFLASVLLGIFAVLGTSLTAAGIYQAQLPQTALLLAIHAAACRALVPEGGSIGAYRATALMATVGIISSAALLAHRSFSHHERGRS